MDDYSGAALMAAILDLRDATANGFARADEKTERLREDMNRRFDRLLADVDGRFARVENRFDRMDERFDRMDQRFDRMDERFDRMDERFDRLEVRVAAIEPHGQRPAS